MKFSKVLICAGLMMSLMVSPSYAAKNVDRVTAWNRFTDFFATVGKEDSAKQQVLKSRKRARREKRQFKQRQRRQKETQKRMAEQKRNIMKTIKTKKVPSGRGGIDLPKHR